MTTTNTAAIVYNKDLKANKDTGLLDVIHNNGLHTARVNFFFYDIKEVLVAAIIGADVEERVNFDWLTKQTEESFETIKRSDIYKIGDEGSHGPLDNEEEEEYIEEEDEDIDEGSHGSLDEEDIE